MKAYWTYESIPELDGVPKREAEGRYLAAKQVALSRHGRVRWLAECCVLAGMAAGFSAVLAPMVGVWGSVGAMIGGALGAAIIARREIGLVRQVLQSAQRQGAASDSADEAVSRRPAWRHSPRP